MLTTNSPWNYLFHKSHSIIYWIPNQTAKTFQLLQDSHAYVQRLGLLYFLNCLYHFFAWHIFRWSKLRNTWHIGSCQEKCVRELPNTLSTDTKENSSMRNKFLASCPKNLRRWVNKNRLLLSQEEAITE